VQKDLLPKLVNDTVKLALQLHPLGKTDGQQEVENFVAQNGHKNLELPYNIIFK